MAELLSFIFDIEPLPVVTAVVVVVIALCARHSWQKVTPHRRSRNGGDHWRRDGT